MEQKERKRYLNDEQCQEVAGRIKAQMPQYADARAAWDKIPNPKSSYPFLFIPVWPADLEQVNERVTRLFHPAEAAVIMAAVAKED
jgi:hypothetical protein